LNKRVSDSHAKTVPGYKEASHSGYSIFEVSKETKKNDYIIKDFVMTQVDRHAVLLPRQGLVKDLNQRFFSIASNFYMKTLSALTVRACMEKWLKVMNFARLHWTLYTYRNCAVPHTGEFKMAIERSDAWTQIFQIRISAIQGWEVVKVLHLTVYNDDFCTATPKELRYELAY
jgi:hypothetical protein